MFLLVVLYILSNGFKTCLDSYLCEIKREKDYLTVRIPKRIKYSLPDSKGVTNKLYQFIYGISVTSLIMSQTKVESQSLSYTH